QRAMTEARPYRLHLDVQTQTYWLTAQDGGLFIEPDDDLGRVFELPEDVEAVWLDAELYEVEREFVTFYPSGRTEPAGIRFYGRRDESIDIACDSATGRYRILTDEELAKRPPIEVTDQEKVGRFDDTNDSMFGGRNRR